MTEDSYSIESRLLLGAVLTSLQASIQVLGAYCQAAGNGQVPPALGECCGHAILAADRLSRELSLNRPDGPLNGERYLEEHFRFLANERQDIEQKRQFLNPN